MNAKGIKHFYIPEEQSIYLLSHTDAKKLKDWLALCTEQLSALGYRDIHLIGKGAYGFAFAGVDRQQQHRVFSPEATQKRDAHTAFSSSPSRHGRHRTITDCKSDIAHGL